MPSGRTQMKARYLFLSVLAATALPIPAPDASVLLIFGQTGMADTVTGTRTGSSTTITSSAPVDITEIDAPLGIPISATSLSMPTALVRPLRWVLRGGG